MSVDHDPPDVADQLRAFGETLQREAREPITSGRVRAPATASARARRLPVVLGVAACLVAVVGGLVWIGRTRDDRIAEQPAASSPTVTTVPATTTTIPPTTTTLPRLREAVPSDPLGLTGTGDWGLDERIEEDWRRSATDECAAVQEQSALNGRPTVYERYSGTNAVSLDLDVTFLDAGTTQDALAVSSAYTARLQCDGAADRVALPERVRSLSSVAVGGFRIGEEFAVIAVAGPGNVVITFELEEEGVTDALIEDLVRRASTFLGRTPNVNPYKMLIAVDGPAELMSRLLATGQYVPDETPYGAAAAEVLGAPLHEVIAAGTAARIAIAQVCLADAGFTVTERTFRAFPGTGPVPTGYADSIIESLSVISEDDLTNGQPELPVAADRCWQQAVDQVVDVTDEVPHAWPVVRADEAEVAAAEERHRACLTELGYRADPGVAVDQPFFDQSVAIERSFQQGATTRDEALAQLRELQVAEEADVARRAPCDDELERQIVALGSAEQQAVLDADPGLLQPSAEVVAAMADLQPYLDAIAD